MSSLFVSVNEKTDIWCQQKKTSASFYCHGWVNVCFVKLRKDNNPDGGPLLDPDNQQGAIHPKTPRSSLHGGLRSSAFFRTTKHMWTLWVKSHKASSALERVKICCALLLPRWKPNCSSSIWGSTLGGLLTMEAEDCDATTAGARPPSEREWPPPH